MFNTSLKDQLGKMIPDMSLPERLNLATILVAGYSVLLPFKGMKGGIKAVAILLDLPYQAHNDILRVILGANAFPKDIENTLQAMYNLYHPEEGEE